MRLRMDWLLFWTILALVSFGLIMVYSASSVSLELKRQAAQAAAVEAVDSGNPAFPARRAAAAAFGIAVLFFIRHLKRQGILTRGWSWFGVSLVAMLQLLAYWVEAGQSPHLALLARQSGAALGGFFLLMYLSQRDYRNLRDDRWAFAALGLVIFMVLLANFTDSRGRWLKLVGVSIQPSELAKPALVLFLAWFVTARRDRINHPNTIWPAALSLLMLVAAVGHPDMGTALVLVVTAAVIFYLAGLNWRYTVSAIAVGVVLLGASIVMKPYRLKRVIDFADPTYQKLSYVDPQRWLWKRAQRPQRIVDTRHQVEQATIAISTGGLAGRGLMASRQKLLYLPEAHNDFIYAVVGEEVGFMGSILLLGGFVVILWRGYRLFWTASDDFGRYLAVGVTTTLVFQALFNMSVVLDLVPTKGIPLPLISSGGTSMLSSMILLGLLLSVSQRSSA